MEQRIRAILSQTERLMRDVQEECVESLSHIARLVIAAYRRQATVLVFGNGGSAADSQHIAAELVGRFRKERRPLSCMSLTTNTSILTALANDYDFSCVFERQVIALGREGDIAWGISTSGSAPNVLRAFTAARQRGLTCIAFTGSGGASLRQLTDACLVIPSQETARIQEAHITAAHIVCDLVEDSVADDPR